MSQHVLISGRFTLSIERAVQALLVLNLLDAVFTSWWVSAGWATEANPLMARALELGLAPFIAAKLALGMFAALILRTHAPRHRLARAGLVMALVAYASVTALHLSQSATQASSGKMLTVATIAD
ncbi:MAG: hypothetical protein IPJ65_05720 [Archangiaceae bacterium]|nr:hypothetical protein [Archangiaceae bacterium]